MTKMNMNDFTNAMTKSRANGQTFGVIVFSQDSFMNEYGLKARSYRVSNMEKYFNPEAIGSSLFGNCLDGSDNGVRLDYYMKMYGWKPEYCYMEE